MFGYFPRVVPRKFKEQFRCISLAVAVPDRAKLDSAGKIFLPPSALHKLSNMEVQYPMIFKLKNKMPSGEVKKTHCGVLEFIAREGYCYIPSWIMKQLGLNNGDLIQVKNVTLPSGDGCFVRFQPQQKAFLEIANPRAVLERELGLESKYAALTKGDSILIRYLNKEYYLNVLEIQRSGEPLDAITIIESDISVDFAPAIDDVPVKRESQPTLGIPITGSSPAQAGVGSPAAQSPLSTTPVFSGNGYRLDGKPIRQDSNPRTSTSPAIATSPPSTYKPPVSSTPPQPAASAPANRLVFGGAAAPSQSSATAARKSSNPPAPAAAPAKEEPKFVPFSGAGYRLK